MAFQADPVVETRLSGTGAGVRTPVALTVRSQSASFARSRAATPHRDESSGSRANASSGRNELISFSHTQSRRMTPCGTPVASKRSRPNT